MTQRNVERLIGRLLTDEALRDRYLTAPARTLLDLEAEGWQLTALERDALVALDRHRLAEFADSVDPRIRKAPLLHEGTSPVSPLESPARPQPSSSGTNAGGKESS